MVLLDGVDAITARQTPDRTTHSFLLFEMTIVTTDIALAADALKRGELVAFATETVYGLGADATNGRAVAAIYEAKGRPSFNPLIVHVPSVEAAVHLGEFSADARKLAEAFWPGPLTIVVKRAADCLVSELVSAGLSSIAIRVPGHDGARNLLEAAGVPVAAPSANRSGQISPTRPEHVRAGLEGCIWGMLDMGTCEVGLESTIVSCLEDEPALLRPGGISREQLELALGKPVRGGADNASAPVAPGQLESHYAPSASVRLNAIAPREGEVMLGFGKIDGTMNLSPSGDLKQAAANLFAMLHALDAQGAAVIAVAPIPLEGLGVAINDRLSRAAAPR
jgi:L-threonylcarbamoyladenylate synthase